jgi:hypothetical protein
LSLDSERTFLSGVSALIWIFDEREPVQTPHSAAWACAMNARLAEWCGTPVTYRDLSGEPQASPFTGPFGTFVDAELAKAADCRRSFTEELRREGLKLDPDFGAVIWSARGGVIRPGDLDISLALVWRFSRFQRWFDDTAYGASMPEHDLAAQWQELCALAQDLRNELGPDLRLDLEDRLYRS